MKIVEPLFCAPINHFILEGENVVLNKKYLHQLQGVYQSDIDEDDLDKIAYEVLVNQPSKEVEAGTMQFGVSMLNPYTINGEFSCTQGHFHANKEYDEYYFGLSGEGYLLLWDGQDDLFAQRVYPGSVHYIDGKYAHRLINTSLTDILKVGAVWNLAAGYDYETIKDGGFPVRCFLEDGKVVWKETRI